jgi:hypothetical protein
MNIGIIGSGMVGQALGARLAEIGHDVVIGTRSPDDLSSSRGNSPSLEEWLERAGARGQVASMQGAAAHGTVVINATAGTGSIEALRAAGEDNLNGKILIDVANPLDFSKGMPPTLTVCNTSSLAEEIQAAFPNVKVVKALNTMTAAVMVSPGAVGGGDHTLFIAGNDADAKGKVTAWLNEWFGWRDVIDVGDITAARGTEMILPLWVRLWGVLGTPMFNFRIVR